MFITDRNVLLLLASLLLSWISVFVLFGILHNRLDECDEELGTCFCEPVSNQTISVLAQPVSAISNIAYILLGFMLFFLQTKHKDYVLAGIFNFLLVFLGIGSLYLHSLLSESAYILDVFSILVFLSFIIILPMNELLSTNKHKIIILVIMFLVYTIVSSLVTFLVPESGVTAFIIQAILTGLFLFLELIAMCKCENYKPVKSLYFVSFICLIISLVPMILSNINICGNTVPGSLHAVWHIFSALGIFFYGVGRFQHDYTRTQNHA